MRRTGRWPERPTRFQYRLDRRSSDLIVAARAGQFREQNPCAREDRPGSVSRESFGELLDSLSTSTPHHDRVRRPRCWIVRIDRHHFSIILSKLMSTAGLLDSEVIGVDTGTAERHNRSAMGVERPPASHNGRPSRERIGRGKTPRRWAVSRATSDRYQMLRTPCRFLGERSRETMDAADGRGGDR